jgi:hypothetical protein
MIVWYQGMVHILTNFFDLFFVSADCCHSGTAFDLPYEMNATDTEMHENNSFPWESFGAVGTAVCCYCIMSMILEGLMG